MQLKTENPQRKSNVTHDKNFQQTIQRGEHPQLDVKNIYKKPTANITFNGEK